MATYLVRCLLRRNCRRLPLPSTTAFLTLQVPAHWLAHPLPIPVSSYHCSCGESLSLLHLGLHFLGLSWLGHFPHQPVRSLFCGLVFLAEPFPRWLCCCLASAGPHPVDGARQALQICKACRHRTAGRGEKCADLKESKLKRSRNAGWRGLVPLITDYDPQTGRVSWRQRLERNMPVPEGRRWLASSIEM